MSNKKHWKEQYEDAATNEKKQLSNADVKKLLQDVRKGKFGEYYTSWYAIADHATLEQAGWTLYNVLVSDAEYLPRYHAAAALLKLLKETSFEAVNLSAPRQELKANLTTVRDLLVQKIGEPKDGSIEVREMPAQKVVELTAKKPRKWYEKIFGRK